MASVLDVIKHYQQGIEKNPDDEARVLRCIDKLFHLQVTVQHLQETGVGRTVNALRKEPGDVGKAARALVNRWKMMVAAEESDQEGDHKTDTSLQNGHASSRELENHVHMSQSKQSPEHLENPKSSSSKSSQKENHKTTNGHHSGTKRKYHSSEEEDHDVNKKVRQSSEDNRNKPIVIKQETLTDSESSHDSESSESGDSDSYNSDSSHEKVRVKQEIKQEIKKEKIEPPERHKSSSSKDLQKDPKMESSSSSILQSYKSATDNTKSKDSSRSSSEKSNSHKHISSHDKKESTERRHKDSSSKNEKSPDKRQKTESSSEENKDCKTSNKHSSDKKKYSSHKHSDSDEKHKSRSEKHSSKEHRGSSHSEKHKSSSDKEVELKHKSKERSSSSSKEKHSSSSKEKSKDKSSSSKDKSSSHSTEKKQSSSDSKSQSSSKSKHKHGEKKDKSRSNEKSSSSSSHKSKSSSSQSKDIPKKKSKVSNSEDSDNGIGCESGASFAEALGMISPTKPKKKSQAKDVISPNSSFSNDLSPASLLAPTAKLAPLPAIEISALPDISPSNYKPRPPPKFLPHFNEESAISAGISSKNQRTKVYSGNKVVGKIPSLYELCVHVLQEHIDALEYTGGVPYDILKPVVDRATPQQLFVLEHYNPYLMEETDHLWQKHCQKSFRNKQRQEMETWRDMYIRCQEEQEHRLKSLTANIRMTQEAKKAPIKQTKMAYVDTIVKPPRNVARKQALHGTAHAASASPAARVASLSTSSNILKGGSLRPTPSAPISMSSISKPKKAPLMQKALQFMRGRKR